jgi:hypothetical protein
MNWAVEEVDRQIAAIEAQLAKLRKIRQQLVNDPDLHEFFASLASPPANGSAPFAALPQVRRYGSPLLQQVVAYMQSEDNRWQTVRDIVSATGLSRNSINSLLYTSKHKELFESELQGPKRRVFRLKVQAETQPSQPPNGGMRPKNRPAGYPKEEPWPPPPGIQPLWGPIKDAKDTPLS